MYLVEKEYLKQQKFTECNSPVYITYSIVSCKAQWCHFGLVNYRHLLEWVNITTTIQHQHLTLSEIEVN